MSEVRGRCSVCGATYAIRRDGMVRHHDNGLIFEGYRVCAGSGRPPTTPAPEPEHERRRAAMSDLGELSNVIDTALALGRVDDDQLVTWGQLLRLVNEAIVDDE